MTIIVKANTSGGSERTELEINDNFPLAMSYQDNSLIAHAHSYDELVSVIIDGYLGMNDTEKSRSRRELLQRKAFHTRIIALNSPSADYISDEEYSLLSSKEGLVGENPILQKWSCELPLILLDTDYSPHSKYTRPVSAFPESNNVLWLSPVTDESFLLALHELGNISVFQSDKQ